MEIAASVKCGDASRLHQPKYISTSTVIHTLRVKRRVNRNVIQFVYKTMTSWLASGRPALFDAINNACDLIDQQIASGTSLT